MSPRQLQDRSERPKSGQDLSKTTPRPPKTTQDRNKNASRPPKTAKEPEKTLKINLSEQEREARYM